MRRPRVICHMIASVDGRIVTDGWPLSAEGQRQYEFVHESYEPDAWLCGRVTMEQRFAQRVRPDVEIASEHHGAEREDYRAPGARDIDLALEKIGATFGVRTLMLEGGGRINGGMLRAGLIDEVSVLVAPVVDGRIGTPALFDIDGDDVTPHRLALEAVERRADDVLWLRYRVEGRST